MAITATSTLFDVQKSLQIGNRGLHVQALHYVQAADDDTGTATICLLPAGRIRLDLALSKMTCDDGGDYATMSVGHGAYVSRETLKAVNAVVDSLKTATSIEEGPTTFALGTSGYVEFNSRAGLPITITIANANLPQDSIVTGILVYTFIDD
jgi:hypothetical protein